MRARTVTSTAARNRYAARAPSRVANIAARTGTASQAVDFRSQATPRAIPAPAVRAAVTVAPAGAALRASASSMNASTGGSVVITARLRPTTGEATATAVASRASRRPVGIATRKATASTTTVPTASHTPAFPARPPTPAAAGRPNRVMTGRYGL
jgi:hypothetical protein